MTPVKTRILAGGVHSTKQQIVRIDKATRAAPSERRRAGASLARCARTAGRVDGVLVSDYGFGLLDAGAGAARRSPSRGGGACR